jgi:hypothetical protein
MEGTMAGVQVAQGNTYLAECIKSAKERVVVVSFMLTSLAIVRALCASAPARRAGRTH